MLAYTTEILVKTHNLEQSAIVIVHNKNSLPHLWRHIQFLNIDKSNKFANMAAPIGLTVFSLKLLILKHRNICLAKKIWKYM